MEKRGKDVWNVSKEGVRGKRNPTGTRSRQVSSAEESCIKEGSSRSDIVSEERLKVREHYPGKPFPEHLHKSALEKVSLLEGRTQKKKKKTRSKSRNATKSAPLINRNKERR